MIIHLGDYCCLYVNNRFRSTSLKEMQLPELDSLTCRQQPDRLTLTITRGKIIIEDAFRASFFFPL